MPFPLHIEATELFNETTEEFINIPETSLLLEHSLLSLKNWEGRHHKPFLSDTEKTPEEFIDYIRCMTLTKNVNPAVYYALSVDNIKAIKDYIEDDQTATWFREDEDNKKKPQSKKPQRPVTAELIYCWMIQLRMQVEVFQKWHLGRLIVLIRTCQEEQKAQNPDNNNKKIDMSKRRALMEQRRAKSRARRH